MKNNNKKRRTNKGTTYRDLNRVKETNKESEVPRQDKKCREHGHCIEGAKRGVQCSSRVELGGGSISGVWILKGANGEEIS